MKPVMRTVLKLALAGLILCARAQAAALDCSDTNDWNCQCLLDACANRCGSAGVSTFDCNPVEGERDCVCIP